MSAFEALRKDIASSSLGKRTGKVSSYLGLVVEATGLDVFVGERCLIECADKNIEAEVVGFKQDRAILMPYGSVDGITAKSKVIGLGRKSSIGVGHGLIGRVVDAFGNPLDGKGVIKSEIKLPLRKPAPHNPLLRARVTDRFDTGVKAIDCMTPIGKGQRIGVFAGSGVGKSTLLGMIAKGSSDVINVIALIGERGREVLDFIEERLGHEGLQHSVIVVATSDEPPLVRSHAVFSAIAIAEFFSDQGKNVLLMLDSITRLAMAQREIGLARGEPPTLRGYTPSVFSILPEVLERTGSFKGKGTITAVFAVLVEGDDISEPVTDTMRGILDGHIMLSREVAGKGLFPAIDFSLSNSRLWERFVSDGEKKLISNVKRVLNDKKSIDEMIEMGTYRKGSDSINDIKLRCGNQIENMLTQDANEVCKREACFKSLEKEIEVHNSKTSNSK